MHINLLEAFKKGERLTRLTFLRRSNHHASVFLKMLMELNF